MSSTSVSDLVTLFGNISWSFNYVILPICFILGNIGNTFNLLIFSQRKSRSNSCLLYFFSASIVNIFILNFALLLRIIRGIWNIDPGVTSLWFCRWRTYVVSCFFLIYRLSILLACIDRMCASSRSAWMRHQSRPSIACRAIMLMWLACFVSFMPTLCYQTIIYGLCLTPPSTTYATFITVYSFAQAILVPLGMFVCGVITVIHLKSTRTRISPTAGETHNDRRVVSQYVAMLFVQIVTDFLCNLLYSIYLILSLVYPAPQTTYIATISSFLISMGFTLPYVNFSAAFYLHTLSSAPFRRKLIRLLQRTVCLGRWMAIDRGRQTSNMPLGLRTMPLRNTTAVNERTNQ